MLSWRRAALQVNGAGCSCGWCLPALLVYSGFPKQTPFFSGRNLNSKQEAPKLPPVLSHRQLNRAAGLPQDPAAAGLFPFCIPPSTSQAQPCLPGGCYLTTLPGIVTAASFLPKGLGMLVPCASSFPPFFSLLPFLLPTGRPRDFGALSHSEPCPCSSCHACCSMPQSASRILPCLIVSTSLNIQLSCCQAQTGKA